MTLSEIYKKIEYGEYSVNIQLWIKLNWGTKEDRQAYHREELRLLAELKSDLEAAYYLQQSEKTDLLFKLVQEFSPEDFHGMVRVYRQMVALIL